MTVSSAKTAGANKARSRAERMKRDMLARDRGRCAVRECRVTLNQSGWRSEVVVCGLEVYGVTADDRFQESEGGGEAEALSLGGE